MGKKLRVSVKGQKAKWAEVALPRGWEKWQSIDRKRYLDSLARDYALNVLQVEVVDPEEEARAKAKKGKK